VRPVSPPPAGSVGGGTTATREPARLASRRRLSWLRALPLAGQHLTRTMPWMTLIAGCLAGIVLVAVLAYVADTSHWSLDQGTVRLTFLPAIAGLAFAVRDPFRPLTRITPVPAWVTPAGHLVLAVPILAATCWVQLRIAARTVAPQALAHAPAVYPLIAQLTGWSAIVVAAAACAGRSRYADLGGTVAVLAGFAAVALAWYVPAGGRHLADPPATARAVTVAWYAIAAVALVVTGAAMRDQWHRHVRRPRLRGRRGAVAS
jgi:hypothetical protein